MGNLYKGATDKGIPSPLCKDNKLANNPQEKADMLNDQYVSVCNIDGADDTPQATKDLSPDIKLEEIILTQ